MIDKFRSRSWSTKLQVRYPVSKPLLILKALYKTRDCFHEPNETKPARRSIQSYQNCPMVSEHCNADISVPVPKRADKIRNIENRY